MFPIAYLTICDFKIASASGGKPPDPHWGNIPHFFSNAEIAYLMTCYFENASAFQNSSAYLTSCTFQNASASEGKPYDPNWGKVPTTYDFQKCFSFRGQAPQPPLWWNPTFLAWNVSNCLSDSLWFQNCFSFRGQAPWPPLKFTFLMLKLLIWWLIGNRLFYFQTKYYALI